MFEGFMSYVIEIDMLYVVKDGLIVILNVMLYCCDVLVI